MPNYDLEYYYKNKEKINAKIKEKYNTNPEAREKAKQNSLSYYHRNREAILAKRKEKYRANPQIQKQYILNSANKAKSNTAILQKELEKLEQKRKLIEEKLNNINNNVSSDNNEG